MSRKPTSIVSAAKFCFRRQFHQSKVRSRIPIPNLFDAELLHIALCQTMPAQSLRRAIAELLDRFGSLAGVLSAPKSELKRCGDLNEQATSLILVLRESVLRTTYAAATKRPVVSTSGQLMSYLQALVGHQEVEQVQVLFLNSRNEILACEAQGVGSVNESWIAVREVFRRALELHSTAIILVHNHPSGDPTPSIEDVRLTEEIKTAGAALSIKLHDHLIVACGRSFSMHRHGLI